MMNQNHMDVRMGHDPSSNVPQFVLPHVHLVSSYRFPHQAQLQPNTALDYLLNAPKIVNDAQPVAWTYFQNPPPDGTVILAWQPPPMGQAFASDGYTWVDPESTYTAEMRGYTLEILVHRSGCRYGVEPIATHSRHRYRIVNKNPAASTPFDPNLWIIHYTQAAPDCRFPAAQLQIRPDVQRIMQERGYLEKQGQLQRKEFMLRDRGNWPDVKFAPTMQTMAAQGRPMFNPMQSMGGGMARQAQYYQQPQVPTAGGPPAKRMRQVPPSQMPGTVGGPGVPPTAAGADTSIEDEENTMLGDVLDHLTPREISTMRYTQHHEWMEEVFSSPYAVGQILPVDLGLGLMGELAPLTAGVFEASSADSLPSAANKVAPKSYHKLDPEQLADFERRIAEYTKKEEAELAKMRSDHARKLANLKRSKTYIKAERKLREIAHGPDDSNATRVLEDVSNNSTPQPPRRETPKNDEKSEDIVSEIEAALGIIIGTTKNVVCVDKGGFIEEQVQTVQIQQQVNGTRNGDGVENGRTAAYENDNGNDDNALNGLLDESAMDNTAASLLEQYGGSTSLATTPANPNISHSAQAGRRALSSTGTSGIDSSVLMGQNDGTADLMDLDVDIAGMGDAKEGEGDWVMVDEALNAQPHPSEQPKNSTATSAQAMNPLNPSQPSNTESGAGLFDAADSFNFDNLDTAGDALADYANADDDLGLTLEDSAFGDAFHGTEVHEHGHD